MNWINFLHFYQPANIEDYKIKEALDKSYFRLLRLVEEHPDIKMTWNISGCLLDRLSDMGEYNFIDRLKKLIVKGQIEITSSAAYHGFLPLLPKEEIISQLKINETILKKHFGVAYKKAGFFLPEMAYSSEVAQIIKSHGYKWLILDEYSSGAKINTNHVYIDKASNLKIVFRSREFSNVYPPDMLLKKKTGFYLTATDAELYGLRHEDPTGEMEKVVKNKNLETETISEFIAKNYKKNEKAIKIYPSSWESSLSEIKKGVAYSLWRDKKNKIQTNLWTLAYLSLGLDKEFKRDKNYFWYRWHLVRGLASCTFWWASARDFSKIFGPYAWSPDDIERGLEDLIRSVRSLENKNSKKKKIEAERYYLIIKKLIWADHWQKHWLK